MVQGEPTNIKECFIASQESPILYLNPFHCPSVLIDDSSGPEYLVCMPLPIFAFAPTFLYLILLLFSDLKSVEKNDVQDMAKSVAL